MNTYEPTEEELAQMKIDLQKAIDNKGKDDEDPKLHIYKNEPDEYAPDVVNNKGEILEKGELIKQGQELTGEFTVDDLK